MRIFVIALFVFASSPATAAVLLDDPLDGTTTGKPVGGTFVAGGWQTPGQIVWDLGAPVTAGGVEVTLSSWNPDADSPQFTAQRHDIVSVYAAEHASLLLADKDVPKSAYIALRTGTLYGNRLALVSSAGGAEQELETKASAAKGAVSFPAAHTLRVVWAADGVASVTLDGQDLATHDHHNLLALRYVVVGRNNGPSTTYGSPDGVVVEHVKAWQDEPGKTIILEPVADTWADADHPVLVHGSATTLQTGGGSAAYLRFEVPDLGVIEQATLELTCMKEGAGGSLHRVMDDAWTEAALTWGTQPSAEPAPLGSAGFVSVNGVASYDASATVTGPGTYSFAVISEAPDKAGFHSREGSGPRPVLVLQRAEPVGDPLSCAGHCGGAATSGCGCDASCVTAGTCCDDACGVCGACAPGGEDAGVADAGGADAGSSDDAGAPDAGGAPDAATPDAATPDAASDTANEGDATIDATGPSGPVGGGFNAGAGASDASEPDAVAEPAEEAEGGCRAAGRSGASLLVPVALLLALFGRMRFRNG